MDLLSFGFGFVTCIVCFLLLIYWPEVRTLLSKVGTSIADAVNDISWTVRERILRK
jgi:hypothetical protein